MNLQEHATFVPLDHGMVPLVYGQWIADASNSKILSCFMAVVLKYIYRFVSMIVKVKCKVSFLLTFTLIYLSQIMYFWHFHHLTEFQKDHWCLSILIGGDRHAYNRNNFWGAMILPWITWKFSRKVQWLHGLFCLTTFLHYSCSWSIFSSWCQLWWLVW